MDTLVYILYVEKYEIITFKNDLVQIDVNVSPNEETVWLTLDRCHYYLIEISLLLIGI